MHVTRRPNDTPRDYFRRTISAQLHLLGAIAVFIGGCILIHRANKLEGPQHLMACATFIIAGLVLFSTSSLYHFLHDGHSISTPLENLFEKLDHTAIYLFIAGTYTPFLMNALVGPWRTILLILIWSIAAFGILYTFTRSYLPRWMQNRFLYTGLFLAMGWTLLIRGHAIYTHLNAEQVWLLALGAISYSLGAVIYATRWPRLFVGIFGFHELWHLMVLFGFAFHFFLILSFYPTAVVI